MPNDVFSLYFSDAASFPTWRIGQGWDVHRLGSEKPFILGGVLIQETAGPFAHSDGDVVLHALIDAMLGALGAGDIGTWFSDQDPAYLNCSSRLFFPPVLKKMHSQGYQILNLDLTCHLQLPKLGPFSCLICQTISEILGVSRNQVNFKAKTGEKLGMLGAGHACACDAVILLERSACSSLKKGLSL